MFEDRQCPNWNEPWEPELEFRWAKRIARMIYRANPDLAFVLDAETGGCLFVELRRGEVLIGTFTLSTLQRESPLVSMHMGAEEDEFHLTNLAVIPEIPKHYTSQYT
jgi:hypothetical protein